MGAAMSLVAKLAILRSRKNNNSSIAARETLKNGLTIEAKNNGAWLLSRDGVKPKKLEIEIIARDAKMLNGFGVVTAPAKDPESKSIYCYITPLNDDADFTTCNLCSKCEKRSMLKDVDGASTDCLECGHGAAGSPEPLNLEQMPAPATPTDLEQAEFEALDVETPNRSDHRPGLPLESPRRMKPNQVHHFAAFGVLWVAKVSQNQYGVFIEWAAQEPLEGPDGAYQSGTLAQFETWFKKHGQLSSLEPPERWRA